MKIGINGLGRIGRAIFRRSLEIEEIEICAINEANPDIGNICYTLNYDTIYGSLEEPIKVSDNNLELSSGKKIAVSNCNSIYDVPWKDSGVDYVIEATGIKQNLIDSKVLIEKDICKRGNKKNIYISKNP